jgi:hypothetical protein
VLFGVFGFSQRVIFLLTPHFILKSDGKDQLDGQYQMDLVTFLHVETGFFDSQI